MNSEFLWGFQHKHTSTVCHWIHFIVSACLFSVDVTGDANIYWDRQCFIKTTIRAAGRLIWVCEWAVEDEDIISDLCLWKALLHRSVWLFNSGCWMRLFFTDAVLWLFRISALDTVYIQYMPYNVYYHDCCYYVIVWLYYVKSKVDIQRKTIMFSHSACCDTREFLPWCLPTICKTFVIIQ